MWARVGWLTPEIVLTIYASVISTVALIWNIAVAILERSSRLKVTVEFRNSMTVGSNNKLIKGPIFCFVRIVNRGNQIKYVSSIELHLPYRTASGNMFSLVNQDTQFPIEVLPQQEYVFKFKFFSLAESILENYMDGMCRIVVFDTIHKKYKSNKFISSKIKSAFEYNNSLSELVHTMFSESEKK